MSRPDKESIKPTEANQIEVNNPTGYDDVDIVVEDFIRCSNDEQSVKTVIRVQSGGFSIEISLTNKAKKELAEALAR